MPFLYKKGGRLPGQRSSTVAEAVTSARTSYPNTPPPGIGDVGGGREYGAIPNRGAMMREIDNMMPFTQAPGEGVPSIPQTNPYAPGGSRHVPWMDGPDSYADIGIGRTKFPSWSPEVSQGFTPENPYSWVGVPGGGSVVPPGTEDFLTSTDWTSGITPPSAQTFPSASSYIPDPEFGAVNQYSPAPVNTPFVGAGDPLLADTTTQYDFMAGMNPATGAMSAGGAGAAWTPTGYDVMAGMDPATGPMAYGANPDPYGPLGDRYVPFQSGSPNEQTDVGIGPMLDRADALTMADEMNIPPEGYATANDRNLYRGGAEDATRADMGPLANNLERTAVDYDVAREYDKTSKEINKRLADQRIADHEARYGAMKAEEAERQEKYLEDLAKIQKKQRMFMVLGALSGDPNIASIAGSIAQQDLDVLNKKYEWASGDRTAQMQRALMYNSNGEYDPPESRQELYSALSTMGANSTEMDWFDDQFFGAQDAIEAETGQNYYHPEYGMIRMTESQVNSLPNSYEYIKAGDFSLAELQKGGGKGTAAMREFAMYEDAYKKWQQMPEGDAKNAEYERLARMARAFDLNDTSVLTNEDKVDMFDQLFKGRNSRYSLPKDKNGKQIKIDKTYTKDKAVKEWINSTGRFEGIGLKEQFAEAEEQKSSDDPVTREAVIAAVKKKKPDATEEEIALTLKEYGFN